MIFVDKHTKINTNNIEFKDYTGILYNAINYINNKHLIKDFKLDFYIETFDKSILHSIDNIDDILENNIHMYRYMYKRTYIINYLIEDKFILNISYLDLLIKKLILLIEYYHNTVDIDYINSTFIYQYITNLVTIVIRILNRLI